MSPHDTPPRGKPLTGRIWDTVWTWRPELSVLTVLLGLVTLAAFANAAHDSFVYDDKFFATVSPELTLGSVLKLFREQAWAGSGVRSDLYRPLLLLLLAIEGRIHGNSAWWFHASNIALHVVTTLVLFRLLLALLGDGASSLISAFLAALIFGVHPIHTEVVNSVFNRSEMLATLGVLCATWVVWRWLDTYPKLAFAAAAVIYLAALLCRESAAPLPFLMVLILVFARPELALTREGWRRLWPALGLLVVAVGYLLLRRAALAAPVLAGPAVSVTPGAPGAVALTDLAAGLAQQGSSFIGQFGPPLCLLREGLRLLVYPHPLQAIDHTLGAAGPIHALIIHAFVVLSALFALRSDPGLMLGVAFFYLALLPSTRVLLGHPSEAIAERFLYLPSLAISLGLAFLLRDWTQSQRGKWLAGAALGSVAALFFVWTVSRNADWRSDVALWEADAQSAPSSPEVWRFLTNAYLKTERFADAARICDSQLALHPRAAMLQMHCGIAYDHLNRVSDAEPCHQQAVELGLGAPAHANLARFYDRLGRRKAAEREYLEAIRTEPDPAQQHYRQGKFLLRFYPERAAEAELEFKRALEIQPRYSPAQAALLELRQR